MKTSFFCSLLGVAVFTGIPANTYAQDGTESVYTSFSDAYAAYTSAIETGDQATALGAASAAHELGQTQFGRINANTAALAMNYGNLLASAGSDYAAASELFREADNIYLELYGPTSAERIEALLALAEVQDTHDAKLDSISVVLTMHRAVFPEDDVGFAALQTHTGRLLADAMDGSIEAEEILTEALETLEREFGEDSPELVATLFALGSAVSNWDTPDRRQERYFDRAVEIANSTNSFGPERVADLEIQIALKLVGQLRGDREAIPYAESALDKYAQLFGTDHPKTAFATMTLGQALVGTNDIREALIQINTAIDFYERSAEYHQSLLRARMLLLSVYDAEGDEPGYERELMAVARLSEGSTGIEYLPIVKVAPVYPESAARQGIEGYVLVQYTVDETGHTRDLVVLESDGDRGSGELFHDAALRSAERYRYLPRFQNGEPVSVPGVTTRIIFELAN